MNRGKLKIIVTKVKFVLEAIIMCLFPFFQIQTFRTVFNAVPDIHFVFLIVPSGVTPEPALNDIFETADKKESSQTQDMSVFVCHRHNHAPVLYVRKAR